MNNLFYDTRELDTACRAAYGLTEEIMMENAAASLERVIFENIKSDRNSKRVVILCGSGNNGADGYALARRLKFSVNVDVISCREPSSELCCFQSDIASTMGIDFVEIKEKYLKIISEADFIVDCVFGSGFHGELDNDIQTLMNDVNSLDAVRIACDVPSGIDIDGNVSTSAFCADITVTMGALKMCLYSDAAKDFTGKIIVGDLGVHRAFFEQASAKIKEKAVVMDESDLEETLPHRKNNVHKGNFGHAAVVAGEKKGAALIAASAALRTGAGLVTVVSKEQFNVPMELMNSRTFPENCTAVAFGMGLGRDSPFMTECFEYALKNKDIICVIDADALYSPEITEILEKRPENVILTPHPKEFQALLKNCGLGDYSVEECVSKKVELIENFCRKYPGATLLVKGANTVTGFYGKKGMKLVVNPLGKACLAKAGSGDVLSGIICGFSAQKNYWKEYSSFCYAWMGSQIHAMASRKIKNDYAMTPVDLIEAVAVLGEE